MRFEAAKANGLKEAPTILLQGLTEEKEKEIVIRDNVSSGQFDWDIISSEAWGSIEELTQWDVPLPIGDQIDNAEDGEEIEFEQSLQIAPPKEYILIMADPNSIEWEEIKLKLKLKIVSRGGYKKGSPYHVAGLERVLNWADFKVRYDNSDSK